MRFDDRLLTVLNQPASDRHDLVVRWRQLVDLVARAGADAGSPVIDQAIGTIREDAPRVEEPLRAAAATAIAALPLPLSLLEYFASDRLSVSAPVLAAATLDTNQWNALLLSASDDTRKFIESLHPELRTAAAPAPTERPAPPAGDERAETRPSANAPQAELQVAPPPAPIVEAAAVERQQPPEERLAPSLHDVVDRIERRRRTRAAILGRSATAAAMHDPAVSLFRWECGPSGDINWVEGAPRGPFIGRSIARPVVSGGDLLDGEVVRSFSARAPFRDGLLRVGGDAAVSGSWKISGVPAFEPGDGRFAGYRGIALREQQGDAEEPAASLLPDADSVRELVHEIKTPLTAIVGFAEIIEGQYLGPAERVYRERAQEIVKQARLLVSAIDDLDFVARTQSSAAGVRPRVNLGDLLDRISPALEEMGSGRSVKVELSRPPREILAAAEPELAERLILRLCGAAIALATAGERLRLLVEQVGDRCRVSISKPARLAPLSNEELFGARATVDDGFPLRLLRGLAGSAGAELVAGPAALSLVFARA